MTVQQKLAAIQKTLGLTQTRLAQKFGVSFVAFNNWWTGKSNPREKHLAAIDELFLEITGQRIIPKMRLARKKKYLEQQSQLYKNVISEIQNNPDIRDEFILKLTYHSNSIEGSTLTERETAAVLFDNVALSDKTLIEQMEAKNHQTALHAMLEHVSLKKSLDEAFTLKLHAILLNGIRPDAGTYRNHPVRIVGVNLPTANHLKIPHLMPGIMASVSKKSRDIISACAFVHSGFEQVHPFSDGNGRVGRLLMNAMLLQSNLAPAVIRQEQKQLYYTYLLKAQTNGDHSQLEDFLCDAAMDGFRILERSEEEV